MTSRLDTHIVQDKTNGYGWADIPIIVFPDGHLMLRQGRDRGHAAVADGEINRVTGIAPVKLDAGANNHATIAAVLTRHRANCVPSRSATEFTRPC
jgi:hypothetical protein